jgi:hypothetical protein
VDVIDVRVTHPSPKYLERQLANALEMHSRRASDDGYVMLLGRDEDHFVQFGMGPSLVLDLPLVGLSKRREQIALRILAASGARVLRTEHSDADRTTTFEVLERDFGQDATAAARQAIALFDALYAPGDEPSTIHEFPVPESEGALPVWFCAPEQLEALSSGGWASCPTCGFSFSVADRNVYQGGRHLRCGQRLVVRER